MDYSVVLIEGIRVNVDKSGNCYGFRLKDYIRRMQEGWKELKLDCPYSFAKILDGLHRCIEENLIFMKKNGGLRNMYVRPKIFHSDPVVKPFYGCTTNVVIECLPFGNYLPPSGIAVTVGEYVRTHRYSGYTTKGGGKYVEYGRLRDSAPDEYADVLQLGLGKGGKLIFTEGTSSNLFCVRNGVLMTPGVDDFILKGITRDSILKMAKYLKIPTREEEVSLGVLFEAEEIFLSGTASFITPVNRLGRYQLKVGPVTKKLMDFFEKVRLGKIPYFSSWLTKF